jgi:mRNA interferase HigB
VISKKALTDFGVKHPDAVASLSNWIRITRRAEWRNLAQLCEDFSGEDQVGRRTVFHIAGNKYRLIARVNFRTQRVFVLWIMKHEEYAKGDWK